MKILITGATGNVGYEVISSLFNLKTDNTIVAGVRNCQKAKSKLGEFPELEYTDFDFENEDTFDSALKDIDTVFLLRPPHISDVNKYFKPLINALGRNNVNNIVFLSVQGADKTNIIPHAKIEKLILDSGLDHIFLRPGYFMQNLTTTLLNDIKNKNRIYLPSGNAKFNWIDVQNIGEVAAIVLDDFKEYSNKIFEITGSENLSFGEVAEKLTCILGREIRFESPNVGKFYRTKRKEGLERGLVFVMIFLHYLPRYQKSPYISDSYKKLTGEEPNTLESFISREKYLF